MNKKTVLITGASSGLGFSLVKRIIQDYHQGGVSLIKSIPYQETVFRISLKK